MAPALAPVPALSTALRCRRKQRIRIASRVRMLKMVRKAMPALVPARETGMEWVLEPEQPAIHVAVLLQALLGGRQPDTDSFPLPHLQGLPRVRPVLDVVWPY